MGTMTSQITSLTSVYSTAYRAQIKENLKAPRHWPLSGNSPVTGEFPAQMASNAENVYTWWRHHVYNQVNAEYRNFLDKFKRHWMINSREKIEMATIGNYISEFRTSIITKWRHMTLDTVITIWLGSEL